MALRKIRLKPSMIEDLAALCAIGRDRLFLVADELDAARFTISRSQIEATMRGSLDPEQSALVVRVLFGIARGFRHAPLSAEQVLDSISAEISRISAEDSRFSRWAECKEALQRLLRSQSLTLGAKALDISYDFERVYVEGRVLTSIRPVFNDDRTDIVGSTIVQTLRLEFIGSDGDPVDISVAMDLEDLKQLQGECETAIRKAKIAKAKIEKDAKIDAIIAGEEERS